MIICYSHMIVILWKRFQSSSCTKMTRLALSDNFTCTKQKSCAYIKHTQEYLTHDTRYTKNKGVIMKLWVYF